MLNCREKIEEEIILSTHEWRRPINKIGPHGSPIGIVNEKNY